MSPQEAFTRQFQAFHTAIIDDCKRAARPKQTDSMALRLRDNALALANLQLAMLAATDAESPAFVLTPAPEPARERAPSAESPPPSAERCPPPKDRMLSGDALSRFVSRRLEPDESPHNVWQDLHEAQPAKRRRSPAVTKTGFRSSPG